MRFTLNHLHGFYVAHPKPSSWVLYGSPETNTMGFIWITRNLHHGFYDNPFRETKGFNICLVISINQSEFYVDYPHQPTFKKTQTTNLLWSPYVIGPTIISSSCSFFLLSSFFSSPNLNGRRLDVYHTSTHGVALVRI